MIHLKHLPPKENLKMHFRTFADEQYEVDTGHYILATYYVSNYYYQGQYVSGWDDQYNYTTVESQNWNNYPAYAFYGNGPFFRIHQRHDLRSHEENG